MEPPKARRAPTPRKIQDERIVAWLLQNQEWLKRCYPGCKPAFHVDSPWRSLAKALRAEGFYSPTSGLVDIAIHLESRVVEANARLDEVP